jgi:hypothetical protein
LENVASREELSAVIEVIKNAPAGTAKKGGMGLATDRPVRAITAEARPS